ncbi:AH receptor-interacting protein isoform X3 [Daktulosphaira vitifoliae]|uniref:AH receptor-interacting protein isoform X3 n=1 Tax=Daktulosphaira vitifoliae TaxID=58002 RepID=UPI0021AA4121|nr:AH receptor-interacting protein isoform X3 [Daktulosphaira vitifoliae]
MESTLNDKIQKTIVTPGIGDQPTFSSGTKVSFHFVTRLINGNIIDDSYKWPKHMEIVLGKKFKLEVWETILKSMREREISKFVVHKSLVSSYPFVSKTLRDAGRSTTPKTTSHCCTAQLQQNGIGYDDLNSLLAEPVDLEFTIELLKVEQPGTFEKDTWLMNEEEKIKQIPILKETGNQFYNQGMYKEAEEKYMIALGFLEQIMMKKA